MKSTKKARSRCLIVQPDDLEIGSYYCVLGLKSVSDEEPIQISGMAFRLMAVNLPFVVGRLVSRPNPPLTFDSRFVTFMRVSEDYVAAQRPAEDTP
jgi:hypothetical protein